MILSKRHPRLRVAALVVGALLAAGCSDPPPPPSPAPTPQPPAQPRQRSGPAEFALTPPAGWRPTGSGGSTVAFYVLPGARSGSTQATLRVAVTPAPGDLAADVAGARRLLPTAFTGYTPVIDEPLTLPTGQPAWLLGGLYIDNAQTLRNLQMAVVEDGVSYVLTATAPADRFAEYEPAVRETFNSFALQ